MVRKVKVATGEAKPLTEGNRAWVTWVTERGPNKRPEGAEVGAGRGSDVNRRQMDRQIRRRASEREGSTESCTAGGRPV